MKRRELIRKVRAAADARGVRWFLVREGSEHEIWAIGGRQIAMPRHAELNELTARAILRSLEKELGTRWWER